MSWALISTVAQSLTYWQYPTFDDTGLQITNGQWITETVQPGTIVNLIDYDGTTPYTAPDGTQLQQVPSTAQIGDTGYTVS
jgi:hypothetical protein